MRKGFDGLSGLVQEEMRRNPLDGKVYIFINRRKDRMKLLVWESGGYLLYYKRLEQGQFEIPLSTTSQEIQLEWETLVLMLTGISLQQTRRRKRLKTIT